MSSDLKKIAVIDGNSWLHRAYHAVPPGIKTPDGTPTNAIHGFLNMFQSFVAKANPDAVICAFDAGIPAFRLNAVKQYKAQRKPMDPELRVQFPIIEEILTSMQIPVVKVEGWEGDDILGTIAAKSSEAGFEALLVTGDKDANQLASDKVKIVNMKRGVSDVAILGPDEVYEKYGVRTDQFIDYLALMGDSSDNIPGVPGIGPKTATTLLQKYDSIEGIYAHIDELKGKQKENIENNRDAAEVSQTAATIATDVPIELDLESVVYPGYTKDDIVGTFSKYRLRGALKAALGAIGESLDDGDDSVLQVAVSGKTQAYPSSKNDTVNAEETNLGPAPKIIDAAFVVEDEAQKFACGLIEGGKKLSISVGHTIEAPVQQTLFDTEDAEADTYKNLLVSFCDGEKIALLEGDDGAQVLASAIRRSNQNQIIAEDGKEILRLLYPANSDDEALLTEVELFDADIFDIGLSAYVLDSSRSEYGALDVYNQLYSEILPDPAADEDKVKAAQKNDLDYLVRKNKNIKKRVAFKSAVAFALHEPLISALKQTENEEVYYDIEKPLTAVLVQMERVGSKIDTQRMSELSRYTESKINQLNKEIFDMAGGEFNIDSPKQLAHILFEVKGLPAKKKTKTGFSTNADVLEDLAQLDPLPAAVLDYREYAKMRSTYIEALPRLQASDGRIHTTFHQRKTATGRLSSSDPNIQNIPTRSEFGIKIRECFIPLCAGEKFLCADYSQIELRLLAHLSSDKGLIDAFNSGRDFHATTAASVFGVAPDDVTKQQRSAAKAVNFGIIYGQQAYGLSQALRIGVSEAGEIIEKYFNTYPRVREYLDDVVRDATEKGYAETMFGRRRYIPELAGNGRLRAFGQRTAMNHPMQGSAADIIKLAMRRVSDEVTKAGLHAKCMMQVHDELDFSVPEQQVDALSKIVKDAMENVVKLQVLLIAEVSKGGNWADAK